jgi:hypothetical protein
VKVYSLEVVIKAECFGGKWAQKVQKIKLNWTITTNARAKEKYGGGKNMKLIFVLFPFPFQFYVQSEKGEILGIASSTTWRISLPNFSFKQPHLRAIKFTSH